MTIPKPFRRTYRQFSDGHYNEGGRAQYVTHCRFAQAPEHYVRGFLLLLKDVQELFDYIEPAAANLDCYSFRIHSLLMRACIEVEANCKAILKENGYSKNDDWNMKDYKKLNQTHFLSDYAVEMPVWTGADSMRQPFLAWSNNKALPWYSAYNSTKHDRYASFPSATFRNLLDSCCGLLVLLSAQFGTHDFSPGDALFALEGPNDGMESGIGGYFRVRFPSSIPEDMRYDFEWHKLRNEPDPFATIDYSAIA